MSEMQNQESFEDQEVSSIEDETADNQENTEEIVADIKQNGTSNGVADPDVIEDTDTDGERPEGVQWYVIHSYAGYEMKVKKNLEYRIESMQMQNQIFQVVVPTEEEVELKDGERRVTERRVFPGYIMVEMLMNEESWYVVRNTPGVTGFVGFGNDPSPLGDDEVDRILKRMEAEAPKIKVNFKMGQQVRIVEGPFEDFMGVVDAIDLDRARVRVLVNFFGRETPVDLDFLQVERS